MAVVTQITAANAIITATQIIAAADAIPIAEFKEKRQLSLPYRCLRFFIAFGMTAAGVCYDYKLSKIVNAQCN